jgi:hypothetical protein
MSNYNVNKCLQRGVKIAYFPTAENKYIDDYIYSPMGKNDQVKEKNWVTSRGRYYLNHSYFDVYYKPSPISGVNYKFSSYCTKRAY